MSRAWSLTQEQRHSTVQRVMANILGIGFVKDLKIDDEMAHTMASSFERRAYTAAEVAACTTTGARPFSESTQAYARKMADLVIEMIKNGGKCELDANIPVVGRDAESLDLLGGRDFLTQESAEQALAPMLTHGAKISKIRFSSKSFGRDAAQVAAKAIGNVAQSLSFADISDVIAGRPEDEALDALRIMSQALASVNSLKLLNLSDNALGEKGLRACADALTKQPHLESLALQNVGCSINACRAAAELITQSDSLQQLHLFNNMSDNQGAMHIASILSRAPRMQDFRMASSRVGPEGGIALSRGLSTGSSLVRLDLSDNPMTEEAAPALAALLRCQPQIKVINLNDTGLGDKGVLEVAKAVAEACPHVEELELALNEITPQGAKAVAVAIANKSTLRRLVLSENELEDRGAVWIAKAIPTAGNLQYVELSTNQIKRVGAVTVAKSVASLPNLQYLGLNDNTISDDGLEELKAIMNSSGKAGALGPLEDNMEEDDEELDAEEDEDDLGLSALMARAEI